MPEVVVDRERRKTVNMLVPAFDFGSMSAGFFGVFQVARFVKSCGYHVRLVLFDNFNFDYELAKHKLLNYPGLERLFDELEVVYIGDRKEPLRVSPNDFAIATVWYSAYLAQKIMNLCGDKPFLYLIQDYETAFYPANSNYAFAEATYSFNYHAFFSTEPLLEFFKLRGIGRFARDSSKAIFFNNACSCSLPSKEFVSDRLSTSRRRKLAFYSRPPVDRNMFDLGALTLVTAYEAGVFRDHDWEFVGIGLGEAIIELAPGVEMVQMERLNLRDYQKIIGTFDIGFSLMASPHPSLLPFDLSGSGAVVVTNSFANKDQTYFDRIAPGVIAAEPNLASQISALSEAVSRVDNLETRFRSAKAMKFAKTWEESFDAKHRKFIVNLMGGVDV